MCVALGFIQNYYIMNCTATAAYNITIFTFTFKSHKSCTETELAIPRPHLHWRQLLLGCHHRDELLVVDLAVPVNVRLPDHLVHLLVCQLLAQVGHNMPAIAFHKLHFIKFQEKKPVSEMKRIKYYRYLAIRTISFHKGQTDVQIIIIHQYG